MKKYYFLTVTFLLAAYFCNAQQNDRQSKIEALKIAYITKELNLSAEEAQKFWPVFNEYAKNLKTVRREHLTDELAFEEKALDIRKRFKTDFKKVLVDDGRVNKIYSMERNFRDALKKELEVRQQNKRENLPKQRRN